MKGCAYALLFALGACSVIPSQPSALDEELDQLLHQWTGEYAPDTDIQGPIRPYVMAREVSLPKFGDRAVYMEVRDRSRSGKVLRQRIFAFDTSPERRMNKIKSYDFWDDAGRPYAGAYDTPALLNDLEPGEMYTFPEGCEIFWRKEAATYVGEVTRDRCHIPSRTRGTTVSVDMILGVTGSAFTQWEVGYNNENNLIFGDPTSAAIISRKIKNNTP